MIPKSEILKTLAGYDKKKLAIATLCSHSALQIFTGAKQEGFKTIGIVTKKKKPMYDAFPLAKPDEYIVVDDYHSSADALNSLAERNVIFVPHGSLIEYVGKDIGNLRVPIFGNRRVLFWEADRHKMFQWMKKAGLRMPSSTGPDKIKGPHIVKFPGAKGGRGYLIVSSPKEFREKTTHLIREGVVAKKDVEGALIQEYLTGVRFYPHYFYSPLEKEGLRVGEGRLEMLSVDRRIETNIEEIYRSHAAGLKTEPSFAVVGNMPVILRESLLVDIMDMGKRVVEASIDLFGGIPGPFCIETICDDEFKFSAFEISARIVAGTNLYPKFSPYTPYIFKEEMSTGRRIAREIRLAVAQNKLDKVIY
ncbi:5-formaminoimidazole-4-carboxamide-1-(beta)-D-ribofuranosyl 5'-monophosphate synthetase [Candidatus Burarchaeum australiense]|nr:5-formaminoimidazole-4-carboxamide-1-(beta)-D-ribofuranosyl 5'-monophosphate synthetase [Candidatus Burarchaeum australiense]